MNPDLLRRTIWGRDELLVEIEVPADERRIYATGRNGFFGDIRAVSLNQVSGGGEVYLRVTGKAGKRLNAGIDMPPEILDELARRWIAAREEQAQCASPA